MTEERKHFLEKINARAFYIVALIIILSFAGRLKNLYQNVTGDALDPLLEIKPGTHYTVVDILLHPAGLKYTVDEPVGFKWIYYPEQFSKDVPYEFVFSADSMLVSVRLLD